MRLSSFVVAGALRYARMRGIWLLASRGGSLGEVNEPPPRRILFPSTTITHAESTNQERKQHGDCEYKPTRFDGIDGRWIRDRVLLSSLFLSKNLLYGSLFVDLSVFDRSFFSFLSFFQRYANPLNSRHGDRHLRSIRDRKKLPVADKRDFILAKIVSLDENRGKNLWTHAYVLRSNLRVEKRARNI